MTHHARRRVADVQEPKDGSAKAGVLAVAALLCAAQGYLALAALTGLAALALVVWVLWARRS